MKKISIIIPVYNSEKFISKTISCLKRQTLDDLEFIIVNDGSTDNSLNICKNLTKGDKRFNIISQANKGVSAARNEGIKYAHGKYFLFLDSDDTFDDDMCESMYKVATEQDADLIIFGIKIQELDGNVRYMNNTKVTEKWDLNKALTEFYNRRRLNIGVHTKLFGRNIIEKIKFEEGKKINEDKFFLFEGILNAEKIIYSDQCKYLYIRRMGSASNSSYHPKYKDAIYFSKKIIKIVNSKFPEFKIKAYQDYMNNLLFTFRKLCKKKENKEIYIEDYRELKSEIKKANLKLLHGYSFINKSEVIFIKLFGDLYFYIIKTIYRKKRG